LGDLKTAVACIDDYVFVTVQLRAKGVILLLSDLKPLKPTSPSLLKIVAHSLIFFQTLAWKVSFF
jgi:hypothetical protein